MPAANAGNGAPSLAVLSAGAAKGVVEAVRPAWRADAQGDIAGTYGAVGAIRERFVAGDACDVLILTAKQLEELADAGAVDRASIVPLGSVATAIAVRTGDPHPRVDTAAALRACLAGARALYCPDTERATAGIHFADVLRRLGLWALAAPRIRASPSGAIAMRALGDDPETGAIGCTQVTEILYTHGVDLVGELPPEFALATVYAAGVATATAKPDVARRFVARLSSPGTRELRERGGFSCT